MRNLLNHCIEVTAISNDEKLIKFYNLLNNKYDYYNNSLFCDIVRINYIPIQTNKDKYYEYLNYLLHAKITGNNYRKRIFTWLYITSKWINESKHENSNSICYHKNFNVSEKYFKNIKDLYEFVEYYDYIKEKLNDNNVTKKNKYCDYIKTLFSLYHAMKYEMDM
ncbi:hypothetical protein PCYB_007330 [Plasmodium cynomolgi strain B]|uniref:CYIR protein n=1 Tax=Plasmodium cynomolgi (strain B) TaxID=1120755 RepID=K6V0Y7_PLACD|nr:hypothetical protein PCYB_007330 [Plasmodium cynomolgi strain B]GAB69984.1 hypothetical protein PCYB_007330 [Plasmodium cynomolgi strain B]